MGDFDFELIFLLIPVCMVVADSGYLKSLSLPNVALNFDGIEQIVENGILTKKGEIYCFLDMLRSVMFFLGKAKYYHSISSSTRRDL